MKLSHLTVQKKLFIITLITLMGYVVVLASEIWIERKTLFDKRKRELLNVVSVGKSVIETFHDLSKKDVITDEQAKFLARKVLKKVKHDNEKTFFVINKAGDYIVHPLSQQLAVEGLPQTEIDELEALIRESYKENNIIKHWSLHRGRCTEKLSISSVYNPWGWIVGSSVLVEDVESTFIKNILNETFVIVPMIILALLASYIIAHSIITPLKEIYSELLEICKENKHFAQRVSDSESSELTKILNALHAVRDLTSALREAYHKENLLNNQLQKYKSDLEEFIFLISHDLLAPLRRIAMFSSLIRDEYPRLEEKEIFKYTDIISSSTYKLSEMAADILKFSKLGLVPLNKSLCEVEECFRESLHEHEADLKSFTVNFETINLPKINIDRKLMTRVFSNLIGNSIKFRKPGQPLEISLKAKNIRSKWLFTYTDNGKGFQDTQNIKKIFSPFRKGHNDNTIPGKGLGLAFCKNIITKHNGEIWGDPRYKKGARICFTLLN